MIGNSLEAERQAILERMQARREHYRLMLTTGIDLNDNAVTVEPHSPAYPLQHSFMPQAVHNSVPAYSQRFHASPAGVQHGPVVRVLMEHPYLCALGIAAVVAIGPRRIFNTLSKGGAALGAVAANNQSNLDMVGRMLALAGAYVQGRSGQ